MLRRRSASKRLLTRSARLNWRARLLQQLQLCMSSTTAVATGPCTSTIPARYHSLVSRSVSTWPVMQVFSASSRKVLNVALWTRIPFLFAPRFRGSPACSFLQATKVISLLPVQCGVVQPLPVCLCSPFDIPSGLCVFDSFARN
jgi:hypothetical protein